MLTGQLLTDDHGNPELDLHRAIRTARQSKVPKARAFRPVRNTPPARYSQNRPHEGDRDHTSRVREGPGPGYGAPLQVV